jgi:hypothetical protein
MTAPKGSTAPTPQANPTSAELNAIRRLIKRAGSEGNLHRWIRIAYERRRGRPRDSSRFRDYDDAVVWIADTFSALSKGKLTLHAALRIIAEKGPLRWTPERGLSAESMVKRQQAKARADRIAFEKVWKNMTQHDLDREMEQFIAKLEKLPPDIAAGYLSLFLALNKVPD